MLKVATHGERNKFCRGKCTRPWPLTSSAYQMLRIVKTKKRGVFGSWGGSHPLDIMEYTLAIDFLVILQLYQQVQQVRHVVSPTLLDHIGRALDTAAVAILQSLRPAGAGLQLLLDVQGRGSMRSWMRATGTAKWWFTRPGGLRKGDCYYRPWPLSLWWRQLYPPWRPWFHQRRRWLQLILADQSQ